MISSGRSNIPNSDAYVRDLRATIRYTIGHAKLLELEGSGWDDHLQLGPEYAFNSQGQSVLTDCSSADDLH